MVSKRRGPIDRYCVVCRRQLVHGQSKWCSPKCRVQGGARNLRVKDPTPQQIAARCLEVQATWTERTREHRRVTKTKPLLARRWIYRGEAIGYREVEVHERENWWQGPAGHDQTAG